MKKLLFINNVKLELSNNLTDSSTTMTVSKAQEPFRNPILDSQNPDFTEFFIRLTIVDNLNPEQIEIVTVTEVIEETGNSYTFSIIRGEEDTQPQNFDSGAIVYMAHTAESINRSRPKFINDIGDVDINDAASGDVLYWNGSRWKNCTIDYFKDSSVTITIGTFGDQAIPIDTDVIGVVSESALLSGDWKAISKPEGAVEIDLRISDFGTNPEPADSILNGNQLVITDTRYNNGMSSELQNFLLEKGKVLSLVIVSTDQQVEWLSLTLDGRVVISTENAC